MPLEFWHCYMVSNLCMALAVAFVKMNNNVTFLYHSRHYGCMAY